MKYPVYLLLAVLVIGCQQPVQKVDRKPIISQKMSNLPAGWSPMVNQTTLPGHAGYAIRHGKTGIILVWVPGGSFQMGVTPEMAKELWTKWGKGQVERYIDFSDAPAHKVTLPGFWIGRSEVTIGQYCQIMGRPSGRTFSFNQAELEKTKPDCDLITDVTWQEAKKFCEKAGLRLPTEEEWEYAARGIDSKIFPWGSGFSEEMLRNDGSWCGALNLAVGVREWVNGELGGRKVIKGGMDGDRQPYSLFAFGRTTISRSRIENIGFRVAMSGS